MSVDREFSGWLKGKFIPTSKLNGKKKRSEVSKRRWDNFRKREAEEAALEDRTRDLGNLANTTKRRIVELSQLSQDLYCNKCHVVLSLRNFVREEQHTAFILYVRCVECDQVVRVHTSETSSESNGRLFDVNQKLAIGVF